MTNPARPLDKSEIDDFLATSVIARLATVGSDGAPHVVPIWQHWDGSSMWLIPRGRSAFVEHLRHEPRVCVSCADDVNPEHTRVTLHGRAEIVQGPEPIAGLMEEVANHLRAKYLGTDPTGYVDATKDRPRYLIRIEPERITSWHGQSWHPRYVD